MSNNPQTDQVALRDRTTTHATDAEALAEARATNQRLNREKQQLESELAAYRRAVADWEINEHGTYVPLRTLAAIAKVAGIDVPERWELHYERVERADAELRRMADEAQQPAECSPACSEQHTYSPGCALALVEAQQQPEMRPARGDRFEAWLKAQRDLYDRTDEREESSEFWHEFDRALDEYRLHADTGTPLSEPVSGPGRVADEDPAETDPRPCGDQLTEWTCTLRSGRHDGWQHHDEIEGVWWDQCRVEPYSNRDQLAAEAPQ